MNKKLIIEELKRIVRDTQDVLVVVEGKNDKYAVLNLGYRRVICLNKPLFEIIEGLESEKEVIILTDLDRKGRELYHILKSGLERRGVRVLEKPRKIIKRLGYTHIEGINIDEDNF